LNLFLPILLSSSSAVTLTLSKLLDINHICLYSIIMHIGDRDWVGRDFFRLYS
jgi:hypothetical protein